MGRKKEAEYLRSLPLFLFFVTGVYCYSASNVPSSGSIWKSSSGMSIVSSSA